MSEKVVPYPYVSSLSGFTVTCSSSAGRDSVRLFSLSAELCFAYANNAKIKSKINVGGFELLQTGAVTQAELRGNPFNAAGSELVNVQPVHHGGCGGWGVCGGSGIIRNS